MPMRETEALIIGGPMNGTVVDVTRNPRLAMYKPVGRQALYDPSETTRPFVVDEEMYTIEAKKVGIPLYLFLDGVDEDQILRTLRQFVVPRVMNELMQITTTEAAHKARQEEAAKIHEYRKYWAENRAYGPEVL